jgi:hypothetical protein
MYTKIKNLESIMLPPRENYNEPMAERVVFNALDYQKLYKNLFFP